MRIEEFYRQDAKVAEEGERKRRARKTRDLS
jgi:hypothetical protein